MAGEMFDDGFLQWTPEFLLIRQRDRPDLPVRPVRQDAAYRQLICPLAGPARVHGPVQLRDVRVDVLREYGRGVFLPRPRKDHHEHPLRLHRRVPPHIPFQAAVVRVLVRLLDRVDVRVGSPDQDIVQQDLVRACSVKCPVQAVHVVL